jgi:hypothetical protein
VPLVRAHAGRPDAAERQPRLRELEHAIIDCDTASGARLQHARNTRLVIVEHAQRRRPRAGGDVIHRFIELPVRHDRQHRPEDFFAHQGERVGRIEYRSRSKLALGGVLQAVMQRNDLRTCRAGFLQPCT